MLMNAKKELLQVLKNKTIKCAVIYLKTRTCKKRIDLPINYTEAQYQEFLQKLDFEYFNERYYDGDRINGTIWLMSDKGENKWLTRIEHGFYDYWKIDSAPKISRNLFKSKLKKEFLKHLNEYSADECSLKALFDYVEIIALQNNIAVSIILISIDDFLNFDFSNFIIQIVEIRYKDKRIRSISEPSGDFTLEVSNKEI